MTDLREALERAVEQIVEYREGLPESRVTPVSGRADVRRALGELRDGPDGPRRGDRTSSSPRRHPA